MLIGYAPSERLETLTAHTFRTWGIFDSGLGDCPNKPKSIYPKGIRKKSGDQNNGRALTVRCSGLQALRIRKSILRKIRARK